MQLLADFLPLLFFFAAYLYDDLYFAVGVLMVAMPVGLVLKTYLTQETRQDLSGFNDFSSDTWQCDALFSQPPVSVLEAYSLLLGSQYRVSGKPMVWRKDRRGKALRPGC